MASAATLPGNIVESVIEYPLYPYPPIEPPEFVPGYTTGTDPPAAGTGIPPDVGPCILEPGVAVINAPCFDLTGGFDHPGIDGG